MTESKLPHWDLSNVYSGLDSPELAADISKSTSLADKLEQTLQAAVVLGPDSDPAELAAQLNELVDQTNALNTLFFTIRVYLSTFVTTDSYNLAARRKSSELDAFSVRLQQIGTRMETWIGHIAPALDNVLKLPGSAQEHAFSLRETAEQSEYLMSEAEEALAVELNLSGGAAWGKLQGTITSQLSVDFELDGKVQKLPMPALINLRSHPDENVRRRAYEAENVAWESVKEPLAACMNGIKGTVNTLNKHRGRRDALHAPIDTARIDQETLDALLGAMHDSFPVFRRYFSAKAARLGKDKLAWWDMNAPMGKSKKTFSWDETRSFILDNFNAFSPDLGNLAQRAFDFNWIDAEPRTGKRGGAFCTSLTAVKESRVLTNFDGTLDQVFTVAHELGHAFHNDCMFRANRTPMQRSSPMTLNETASIMCETIVTNAALAQAGDDQEKLNILETSLIGSTGVIVDIYSRYLFEKEVFERRVKSELSADDLNEIMEWAQIQTYGEGLDERYLQKWMWTWKPHYYSIGLSFYNFPYAFGLLFGLGLYAIYLERGAAFVPDYIALLSSTGMERAAELAARFGIDIRSKAFWAGSLAQIAKQVDLYETL